jgi:hypothetical protein
MAYDYEVQRGTKNFKSNVAPDLSNIDQVAGKGSRRRPPAEREADVAARWCATFGHKVKYGTCLNCGAAA